jgi:amino acid transporter
MIGDEVKRVRTRVPISIVSATASNAIMQFTFAICLLFTIGDITKVTNSTTGLPLVEVYYLATRSKPVSTILVVATAVVIAIAIFNVFASVSRLTWAFARDNGLPFASVFAKVSCISIIL